MAAIFPAYIFKWIFLNENLWMLIKIPLKFVARSLIDNISALVQILYEQIGVRLLHALETPEFCIKQLIPYMICVAYAY